MLSTLLILLGSALMLVTIMIVILFMIAGVLRRNLVSVKVLIALGVIGSLMIILGALPWGTAQLVGICALVVGGFALFFFVWSPIHQEEKSRKEVFKVREYVRREHIKPAFRFLARILVAVGAILMCDVIGLWAFLFFQGLWSLFSFTELLTILLLLEGSLIGAIGGFMFYGFSEYRLMGQAALWPTLAGEQARGWRERRLSQQKWGFAMLIAGILLILLGLLVTFLTPL